MKRNIQKQISKIKLKLVSLKKYIVSNKMLAIAFVWLSFMWSWSVQTDSLDLAGSKKQGLTIAIIVLIINVLISLYILRYFIKLATKIIKQLGVTKSLILIIPLFALADYLIAWLLAVFWVGPQAQLDSILPIGSASFVVLRTPLIYASRIVGYFGLAGFVWTTLFLLVNKKYRKYSFVPLLTLVIFSLLGIVLYPTKDKAQYQASLISETLTERVPAIKADKEKLVLFPEYGLEKVTNENLTERIDKDPSSEKTYFAGSEQVYKQNRNGHENRLKFGDTQNGLTDYQDKYRLIPGGEDAPYLVRIALRATGQVGTLNYFSYAKAVIKGKEQLKARSIGDNVVLGLAVCSSIIAPQDYRHFVNNGATVLANSASLKPFGGSRLFAWQQQSMGRFMAVANNRYFLQSANSASTYAYDNNGKLLGQKYGVTTMTVNFASIKKKTIYAYLGDWLIWIGASTVVSIQVIPYIENKIKNKRTK